MPRRLTAGAEERRAAWVLVLAALVPFAAAGLWVFTQPVGVPDDTVAGMAELHAGVAIKPKEMRRIDGQAVPGLKVVRVGARAVATLAALAAAAWAARKLGTEWSERLRDDEFLESLGPATRPVIRVTARCLLEMMLVAFGFFFALLTLLIVFTLTQMPAGAPPPVLERILFHAHGDMLYYTAFQFATIVVFAAGWFALLAYQFAGLPGGWRVIAVVAVASAVLLAANKAAYFILPLIGYVVATIAAARAQPDGPSG